MHSLFKDVASCMIIFDLHVVTLTLKINLLLKTLNLAIVSKWEELGLSYFKCAFLVTRRFITYHNFLPSDFDI